MLRTLDSIKGSAKRIVDSGDRRIMTFDAEKIKMFTVADRLRQSHTDNEIAEKILDLICQNLDILTDVDSIEADDENVRINRMLQQKQTFASKSIVVIQPQKTIEEQEGAFK